MADFSCSRFHQENIFERIKNFKLDNINNIFAESRMIKI